MAVKRGTAHGSTGRGSEQTCHRRAGLQGQATYEDSFILPGSQKNMNLKPTPTRRLQDKRDAHANVHNKEDDEESIPLYFAGGNMD